MIKNLKFLRDFFKMGVFLWWSCTIKTYKIQNLPLIFFKYKNLAVNLIYVL